MKMYSVFDPEFKRYGKVVEGIDECKAAILEVLKDTPLPDGVEYVPSEPKLEALPAAQDIMNTCFGGMPAQIGWCNGHNTKLNCFEYHRDSEFDMGCEDYIALHAKFDDIEGGVLDTSKVVAFKVPKGVMIEVYATTLHYAPCHADGEKGFKVMIALPKGTNTDMEKIPVKSPEDKLLWARNKWLIAHEQSDEAKDGAYIGLKGKNIDIAED